MESKNLFIGTVIQNDSRSNTTTGTGVPDGSVQISIEKFPTWTPDSYPWARPMALGTGGGMTQSVCEPPEIGSKIWCWPEKQGLLKNWFYFADLSLAQFNSIQTALPLISAAGVVGQYPDIKFRHYKNGIITGVATTPGAAEVFFIHPAGHVILMNATGIVLQGPVFAGGPAAAGLVVTTLTDPLVDNITGAPHIGSTTVMATP